MAERTDSHRTPRSVLATLVIVVLGAAMTWFLVWTEIQLQPLEVNWRAFGVFAALMLLGSPSAGVGLALVGALINSLALVEPAGVVVRRVAGTALSLSSAGMM